MRYSPRRAYFVLIYGSQVVVISAQTALQILKSRDGWKYPKGLLLAFFSPFKLRPCRTPGEISALGLFMVGFQTSITYHLAQILRYLTKCTMVLLTAPTKREELQKFILVTAEVDVKKTRLLKAASEKLG